MNDYLQSLFLVIIRKIQRKRLRQDFNFFAKIIFYSDKLFYFCKAELN